MWTVKCQILRYVWLHRGIATDFEKGCKVNYLVTQKIWSYNEE